MTTFSLGFPAKFDDDPPLNPVPMYDEGSGVELRRLLDADAAARAGLPPDDENDQVAGIRYAGARLEYLLNGKVRTSGWPHPATPRKRSANWPA